MAQKLVKSKSPRKAQYDNSKGIEKTVTMISHGVGVERIFAETSPVVSKLEVVSKGKIRRSKLYYIRELEGRAAKIQKDVQTNESKLAAAAAKSKAN